MQIVYRYTWFYQYAGKQHSTTADITVLYDPDEPDTTSILSINYHHCPKDEALFNASMAQLDKPEEQATLRDEVDEAWHFGRVTEEEEDTLPDFTDR